MRPRRVFETRSDAGVTPRDICRTEAGCMDECLDRLVGEDGQVHVAWVRVYLPFCLNRSRSGREQELF
jgi:hypothetical protein